MLNSVEHEFFLLINVKMPTIALKRLLFYTFILMSIKISCSAELGMKIFLQTQSLTAISATSLRLSVFLVAEVTS